MTKLSGRIGSNSSEERIVLGLSLGWAGFLLLLDQVSKVVVESTFAKYESRPVIDGFFALTYVTNRGAAWSILEGHGWLLLLVALLVTILAIRFMRYLADGYLERYFAIFTVLAGVAGNSIDRIWRGEVVDFFDFYFGRYHYPVFNIADCAICVGVGIFMLSTLLRPDPKKRNAPENPQ